MQVAHYCKLANVSFGVIASIFTTAAVLNTIVARVFFNQKLSFYKYLGISVIVSGVIWTSLIKT